ncbi:uncharacterized protein Dwil_GK27294 [Drosophila willistoni]|uniref:Insulin-like domain-containing protein n=1 Tax=Drosophila willistoni TaxID=7260 RepID=A0A0Q9X2I9_DROWI|nr:probable insulin-like peptide 5 [Drosophila willistoni]KRF98981.1 uncharacterized protein Dwil_GK27294 [Drosophila willistoni]
MANFNSSKLMLVSMLLLLLALYNATQAMPSKRQVKICGSRLSETMALACPGGFRSYTPHKRSFLNVFDYVELQNDAGDEDDDVVVDGQQSRDGIKYNWQEPKSYNSMMATRRNMRRIVDECCYKSCTFNEMRAYCQ